MVEVGLKDVTVKCVGISSRRKNMITFAKVNEFRTLFLADSIFWTMPKTTVLELAALWTTFISNMKYTVLNRVILRDFYLFFVTFLCLCLNCCTLLIVVLVVLHFIMNLSWQFKKKFWIKYYFEILFIKFILDACFEIWYCLTTQSLTYLTSVESNFFFCITLTLF